MTRTVPYIPHRDEFAGKVAVVTGGSRGLGRHLVEALVSMGADVFFCARDKKEPRAAARTVPDKAHFIRCDLQDPDATRAFIAQAGDFAGRIDYLVNNAAIDPRIELTEATTEDFDKLIAINLRPLFVTSQAAQAYLEAGEGKAVVNISTTNWMLGLAPFALYNAAKSGIIGFSRSLAREWGPLGIRVNCVCPGWIMTPKQLAEHVTEADKEKLLADQCLKFLLSQQHVTPATLFLLSNASAGITGQNIVVDGGKVMQ
ncbi:MAG: SDR family oxidoreductase [Phycisphaerae bacterium]|nr:SDR family oxidoreductase [Phycisphaerae bacterium]